MHLLLEENSLFLSPVYPDRHMDEYIGTGYTENVLILICMHSSRVRRLYTVFIESPSSLDERLSE